MPSTDGSVVLTGLRPDTDYVVEISSTRNGVASPVQRALFHTEAELTQTDTTEYDETASHKVATIKWEDASGLSYQEFRVVAEPIGHPEVSFRLFCLKNERDFSLAS